MNRQIADRLYEYRKNSGLSQEELAEKIGVSRQAVSKWERSEASPDTENLVALAKLYGVSLDEIILGTKSPGNSEEEPSGGTENTQEEIPARDFSSAGEAEQDPEDEPRDHVSFRDGIHVRAKNGDKVDVSFHGVHVEDRRGDRVHVGWDGVHVSKRDGEEVHVSPEEIHAGWNGVWVGEKDRHEKTPLHRFFLQFPYPLITAVAYLIFGFCGICGGWAFGWLIFLTVPLYYSAVSAFFARDPRHFAYPVLVVLIYLLGGFLSSLWHPLWVISLTIPLYYWVCDFYRRKK